MVKQRQIYFYILLHASFLVLQYGSGNTSSIMESPMKREFYSQIQTEKKKNTTHCVCLQEILDAFMDMKDWQGML